MSSYYFYPYIALTGGADGALDSLDGSLLKNGDAAYVVEPVSRRTYIFTLDEDSAAAEDGFNVIAPDANAGDKRWVRTNTPSNETDVRYFGAIGDGVTDDTAAIQSALSAGGYLYLPPLTYLVSGNLTADTAIVVDGYGATLNWASDTTANRGILVTGSSVAFHGLKLDGPQYATEVTTQHGIYAYGADSSNYLTDIVIRDCSFINWGFYGVYLKYVANFQVNHNKISSCNFGGVVALSCSRGSISFNDIYNITATPNAYGIMASRDTSDSLVTDPRSENIAIIGNWVRNVTNWEGIDTHAGQHIRIAGNSVLSCKHGIVATPANDTSAEATWAPLDITIEGNTIDSQVTDGTLESGIIFTGAHDGVSTVNEYGTGTITGNVVRGYGLAADTLGNAIYCHSTQGLAISANSVFYPGNSAMLLSHDNVGFSVIGNTVIDVWSDDQTDPKGIDFGDINNTGIIDGNTFQSASKAATYKNIYAIFIANSAGNYIQVGKNIFIGFTYNISDTGDKANMGSAAGWSTSGTGEDTLASTVIPASTFSAAGRLRVMAVGTRTGNDTTTLKFHFGSNNTTFSATTTGEDWRFEADVFALTTTNNQGCSYKFMGATAFTQDYVTYAANTLADVTMKITGACNNATDVVVQKYMLIERIV
jgi:hypothetical protein